MRRRGAPSTPWELIKLNGSKFRTTRFVKLTIYHFSRRTSASSGGKDTDNADSSLVSAICHTRLALQFIFSWKLKIFIYFSTISFIQISYLLLKILFYFIFIGNEITNWTQNSYLSWKIFRVSYFTTKVQPIQLSILFSMDKFNAYFGF